MSNEKAIIKDNSGGGGRILYGICSSKVAIIVLFVLIFSFFLILNIWTPYICDDYSYSANFNTKELMKSPFEVFESMYAHSFKMNGRIISHGIAQLFMLLPEIVFDIFNSIVSCFVVYSVAKLTMKKGKDDLIRYLFVFLALVAFTPSFGQSWLWQVGAINYLWGIAVLFIFIRPFVKRYKDSEGKSPVVKKVFVIIGSFFAGFYTEVSSFVAIFIALCLLIADNMIHKKSFKTYLWFALLAAGAGYVCMLLMPAEMAAKHGEITFEKIKETVRILITYFWPLFALYAFSFVRAIVKKTDFGTIFSSLVFLFGGIGGGIMLSSASYLPERCLCVVPALILMAVFELYRDTDRWTETVLALFAVYVCVLFAVRIVPGVADIHRCYEENSCRVQLISEAKERGEEDIEIPAIEAKSPYCGFWELQELNTEKTDDWPNVPMARYYGVKTIKGIKN